MKTSLFTIILLSSLMTYAQEGEPQKNFDLKAGERESKLEVIEVTECSAEFVGYFYNSNTGFDFCQFTGNYVVVESYSRESWLSQKGELVPKSYQREKIVKSKPVADQIIIVGTTKTCDRERAKTVCMQRQQRYTTLIGKLDKHKERLNSEEYPRP